MRFGGKTNLIDEIRIEDYKKRDRLRVFGLSRQSELEAD